MSLKLTLSDATLPESAAQADKVVEAELALFEKYMCSGDVQEPMRGPLMRVERAILKTYLMAKLNGRLDG